MSSKGGGWKKPGAGPSNSSSKDKGVDELSNDMANASLDSSQGGGWEVFTKKPRKPAGRSVGWGAQCATPNAWGQPNVVQKLTGSSSGGAWKTQVADPRTNVGETGLPQPPAAIPPPLEKGWDWAARNGSHVACGQGSVEGDDNESDTGAQKPQSEDEDDDDDLVEDDDDLMSDDFDSDDSVKSHETRKKHRWFKHFFDVLDKLSVQQLNEPSRQWHCPACRNGPGAIDWYRGLQPLMAHARTVGAKRVKLHRELAELLDEELIRKGTSSIPIGETYGKWEGLRSSVADKQIVWPPMVVVMNTQLEMDENEEKWLGMGNQELLDYFSSYTKALKARHSYGPKGHRGMSIVIFESTPVGYLEAEHLDKHFTEQGTGRYAWDQNRVLYYPGGKRQLYGYLARKEDLENFNRHCQGKTKLKFDMRSYQETVVIPMKQMSEDNQQLVWLKNKVVKEQKHSKALEESFSMVTQRLRKTQEENRIVRQRTKMQHEQNKEEMDYQESFFKDQISVIHQALEDKERAFEEKLQEEREKVKQITANSITGADDKLRKEKIDEFIYMQAKGIEEFESERDKLSEMHEGKKAEMKKRHLEEQVELEKEFETMLTKLMEQYAPNKTIS
ncbi:Protein SUPPRESSOR OF GENESILENCING [Ranunculus cassubicifolius]